MRIEIKDAERVAEYRKEIRHTFSDKYFNRVASIGKNLRVDRWLFEEVRVEGIENVKEVRDKQLFYVSSHKSLADFLVEPYVLWENKLPIPRLIAGKNLFKFPVKNFWSRCGAIRLDRKAKNKLYIAAFYEELKEDLLKGESLIEYPGGTRNRGNGPEKFQTGVIHVVLDAAKLGRDIYAIPMDIRYDNLIEKDALKVVDMWKAKRDNNLKLGNKIRAEFYDHLCFYSDYLAYIPRLSSNNKGNAYLKFGKAFPINEFDKKSLVEKLQNEVNSLGNQNI